MLREALQHLFTAAPKYVKDMGYLREAIAIEARAKRCKKHWRPHLEKSKQHILTAAKKLTPGAHIMILGSGGLHDVPLDELEQFKITCVDIVHLPAVKKQYKAINFITQDVTGKAETLYQSIREGKIVTGDLERRLSEKPDLIISLNLLSQLAMKLVEYADSYDHDLGICFADNIIKEHVDWLKKQQTDVLLISDISRCYFQGERLVEKIASLPDLELDAPEDQWQWDIAPTGEADKEISIRHNVGAWRL